MYKREKFDIIIQGGQSNAEGGGLGPVETEYKTSNRILYLTAQKKVETIGDRIVITYGQEPLDISVAAERYEVDGLRSDFALTFAQEYINGELLANDRKLLIVRAAVGGTGFQKEHWGLGKQLYSKLVEMTNYALSLNPENRIVGFLWHQGEHDAFEGNTPKNYREQLKNMVLDIRSRYGNMPFIAGDFCYEWKNKNLAICQPIVDVIKRVVNEIGNAGFVTTENLLSNNQKIENGDDIHFCRETLYELGKRYFKKYSELIDIKGLRGNF